MSFWDSSFLWFEAVIASTVLACALAVIGVYSTLRRVLFLPAALSGISGAAAVTTVFVAMLIYGEESHAHGAPGAVAMVVTLSGALLLGMMTLKHVSRGMVIAIVYIATGALTILLGDRMPAETGHVDDLLFGNAVIVERSWMWVALAVSATVLLIHFFAARLFLFVSFDPDSAAASGVPVRLIDGVLFVTMGLAIAVATRTIGALPVFAYSVMPAAAALAVFRSPHAILISAALFGGLSAFFGYWLSFVLSFPTGASTAAVSMIPFILARLWVGLFKDRRRPVIA